MPNIYECLVKLSLKLGKHKIMNVITYRSSIFCQYMSVKRNREKRVDCNSLHYTSTVHKVDLSPWPKQNILLLFILSYCECYHSTQHSNCSLHFIFIRFRATKYVFCNIVCDV